LTGIAGFLPFGFQREELGGDSLESCAGIACAVSFEAGLLSLESDKSGLVFLGGAVGVGHARILANRFANARSIFNKMQFPIFYKGRFLRKSCTICHYCAGYCAKKDRTISAETSQRLK
jgi:hypothetical protein